MALNSTQQAAFNRQISRMKEDGFFLPSKRSLAGDTRYLIVSYGGTGAAALFGVKKQFETVLPKKQLEERVRFLAIDTDAATQKDTKEIKHKDGTTETIDLDTLTNDQFIQLTGSPARLCLDDAKVAEWINPQHKKALKDDLSQLDGTGAGGVRQTGRLTLYPSGNMAAVTAKVTKLVAELTNNNNHDLRIFILSGIAGGTGSGTVIDLTYLIRSILESMPGNVDNPNKLVPTRSKYCGFILLPPTGDSTNPVYISRGNRNGYAALKEINYFMNINARRGSYSLTYGNGKTVTSSKNIFDICYLLDGTSDGVAFTNPREKAIAVLAESMLDMVTASQTANDGQNIQTVDSFMNDESANRRSMVTSKTVAHAVRDAEYIYCALGHSEFAMPIHEIKAYVAKQMFDQIYTLFRKCANVEEDDVQNLLKNTLRRGAKTGSSTMRSMDLELESIFQNPRGGKGGPFFVINLLRDLTVETSRQRRKVKAFRIGMASEDELNNIEQYALHVNNTCFEVYTAAMEALKSMMDDQFGVVVKAGTNGNTYSFMPTSLGSIQNSGYVIQYLNGLINKGSLYQLTASMLQEMIQNKDAWLALTNSDDPTAAPNAMRRFWNDQLDKIISSTMEDFLIKYYSGNPDASYSIDTHQITYPYLQEAANAIYNQMLGSGGSAQPMAGLTGNGLQPSDFNAHTYLMVPECAPNLYNELTNIAAGAVAGQQVKVCKSNASDRVSCYKQYTCIPAFKLVWVCDAEEDYERDIKTVAGIGVHMSETEGGNQWKIFPNLLPMSCWSILPKNTYDNPRERDLANRANHLFDRADSLKLTSFMASVAGVENLVYSVKVLSKEFRPDDSLFRDLDRCIEGTAEKKEKLAAINADAEQRAAQLFAKVAHWDNAAQIPTDLAAAGVAFKNRDLAFSDSILTVGPSDVRPAGWDAYMAKCMLRKLPDVMNEVSGTVMVIEKVMAKVEDTLKRQILVSQFAHCLITGMFTFNEDRMTWQYPDAVGIPQKLAALKQKQEPLFQYYTMYDAFRKNAEIIVAQISRNLKAVAPLMEGDQQCNGYISKAQNFDAAAEALHKELKEWNQKCPIDDFIDGLEKLGYKTKRIKNFYRALYLEVKERVTFGFNQALFFPDLKEDEEDLPIIDEDDVDF